MTLHIKYTHYSRLFPEWATPDHVIVHVQFSSGVTICQCALQRMVNTLHVRGNNGNKWCAYCLVQIENCFRLNPRVFTNHSVQLHHFCHNFDPLHGTVHKYWRRSG